VREPAISAYKLSPNAVVTVIEKELATPKSLDHTSLFPNAINARYLTRKFYIVYR